MPETDTSPQAERALSGARRTALIVLAVATAIGSAGLAGGGTAGALLGAELTGSDAGAGLPLGVLVAGSAGAARLISRRTRQGGRGRSLMLGYLLGAAGGVLVIAAAVVSSLPALLAGSALLGAANSSVFLTRYAAAEVGGVAARGRALGVVFFATAVGAVSSPSMLGPSGDLAHALGLPRLSGLYVVAVLAFTVAALLLAAVSSPAVPYAGRGAALLGTSEGPKVTRQEPAAGLATVPARLALAVLAATNVVMVAVMAVAPVHLTGHGHGLDLIGIIISIHVAGMFLPSPISGWVADRVGPV